MRRLALATCAAALAACQTPRSLVVGQTAAPLAPGAAEASASFGLGIESQLDPAPPGSPPTDSTVILTAPYFEGNVAFGLSPRLTLDAHVGPGGLEPGLRISLVHGDFDLALLPSASLGYFGSRADDGGPRWVSNFAGLVASGGLSAIVSAEGVGYAAAGYHFRAWTFQSSGSQQGDALSATTTEHDLTLAVGYAHPVGDGEIRVELGVLWAPSMETHGKREDGSTYDAAGGWAFAFLPSITLVMANAPGAGRPSATTPP